MFLFKFYFMCGRHDKGRSKLIVKEITGDRAE